MHLRISSCRFKFCVLFIWLFSPGPWSCNSLPYPGSDPHEYQALIFGCSRGTQSRHGSIAPDWCQKSAGLSRSFSEIYQRYFWLQNSRFFDRARSWKQVDMVVPTYNMEPANPPIASILRSEGTSPKSHRLNLNSSRDRICTFFRFRMDMDHYVLSSLASLLFPEP